jgi:hypothetical protein
MVRPFKEVVSIKLIVFILLTLLPFFLITDIYNSKYSLKAKKNSYWVWAGISIADVPSSDAPLYLYQGLITKENEYIRFLHRGLFPHPLPNRNIHLVFRMNFLDKSSAFTNTILAIVDDWNYHGNHIKGIQLDFDSPTAKISEYAKFLKEVRNKLPQEYELSVTGLGDWLISGTPDSLSSISKNVNYIVFQLYHVNRPLENMELYFDKLGKLNFPFKIGLLNNTSSIIPDNSFLNYNKFFLGKIYFLQKIKVNYK